MEQLNFFGDAGQTAGLPPDILAYHPNIFSTSESAALLASFIVDVPWE